jgi:hypothetical protein
LIMGLGGELPKLPNFGKQLNFDHLAREAPSGRRP